VLDLASYCLYIAGHLSDELFAVATSSRPSRAEGLRHLTYGHRISGCQIAGILFVLLRAFVVESLPSRGSSFDWRVFFLELRALERRRASCLSRRNEIESEVEGMTKPCEVRCYRCYTSASHV
jgi:hypothetical protein